MANKNKLSDDLVTVISQERASGASLEFLGGKYGVSRETVATALRNRGVDTSRKPVLSDSLALEAAEEYKNGVSADRLMGKYNTTAMTILAAIRRVGGEVRAKPRTLLSREKKNRLTDMARSGASVSEVAAEFGLSHKKTTYLLREDGIESIKGRRVYDLDESFFDVIDTEAKAAYLGFICADGCVYRNRLTIALKGSDRGYLEKFATAIGTDQPIVNSYRPTKFKRYCSTLFTEESRLSVCSKGVCDALRNLGVHPNKTFTIKPCCVPEELERHYWRGVVDGDGWVSLKKNNVGLCGNEFMVSGFVHFVEKATGISISSHKHKGQNIWYANYQRRDYARQVAKLLYDDATVCLERKFRNAKKVMK